MDLNERGIANPEMASHMQKRNGDDPQNSFNVLGEHI